MNLTMFGLSRQGKKKTLSMGEILEGVLVKQLKLKVAYFSFIRVQEMYTTNVQNLIYFFASIF